MNNNTVINNKKSEAQERREAFLSKVAGICQEHGGMCQAGKNIVIVNTNKYDVKLKTKR